MLADPATRQNAWEHYVPLDPAMMNDLEMPPRGVCEFGQWEWNRELESQAKLATIASYWEGIKCDPLEPRQRRLFPRPDADLSDLEDAKRWGIRNRLAPVGILSCTSALPFHGGLVIGVQRGELGYGLALSQSAGCTQYLDWAGVVHICMLPPHFRTWWWEE